MSSDILTDGNIAPFLFDVNFAAPEAVAPIPSIALPDHETALRVAEEKGHQRGLEEGRSGEEARLANEAVRIAKAAEKILAAIDKDRLRLEKETADLALVIARKLASEALSHYPLAEIERLISDCLGPLRKTPHLVVRLHENEAAAITETVGKFARETGFEGRFIVLGEPDFQPGDCRIEWADGGIIRDRAKAENEMVAAFEQYFSVALDEPDSAVNEVKEPDRHE